MDDHERDRQALVDQAVARMTRRQRLARWWSWHWPGALVIAALLAATAALGHWTYR